jgi:sec-independent protein translocase protein TatC
MFLAFGITFEIPLVELVLVRTGAVTVEKLKEVRGFVVVGAFVIAAVVTPPDMLSQLLLAIPMCILYQLGILAASFVRPREEDEADPYRRAPDTGMESDLDKAEADEKSR